MESLSVKFVDSPATVSSLADGETITLAQVAEPLGRFCDASFQQLLATRTTPVSRGCKPAIPLHVHSIAISGVGYPDACSIFGFLLAKNESESPPLIASFCHTQNTTALTMHEYCGLPAAAYASSTDHSANNQRHFETPMASSRTPFTL